MGTKLLVVGSVCAALVSPGLAHAESHRDSPGRTFEPATAPPGYVEVHSGPILALAGHTGGTNVFCPTGTVVYSGGAINSSADLGFNMRESRPQEFGTGWEARFTNISTSDETFDVYAICATKPKGYKLISSFGTVSVGAQGGKTTKCPGKLRVLGGGGGMEIVSPLASLSSSFPNTKNSWRTVGNNMLGQDVTIATDVVCGKSVKGLTRVIGPAVLNPAGNQTLAVATCPANLFPVGGGVASSGGILVNLNMTVAAANEWDVLVNNAAAVDDTITPYVVCAGNP